MECFCECSNPDPTMERHYYVFYQRDFGLFMDRFDTGRGFATDSIWSHPIRGRNSPNCRIERSTMQLRMFPMFLSAGKEDEE